MNRPILRKPLTTCGAIQVLLCRSTACLTFHLAKTRVYQAKKLSTLQTHEHALLLSLSAEIP
jgi:hypothetical protein